jgi:hypothetical protein
MTDIISGAILGTEGSAIIRSILISRDKKTSRTPARVAIKIKRPPGFWRASEGKNTGGRRNIFVRCIVYQVIRFIMRSFPGRDSHVTFDLEVLYTGDIDRQSGECCCDAVYVGFADVSAGYARGIVALLERATSDSRILFYRRARCKL